MTLVQDTSSRDTRDQSASVSDYNITRLIHRSLSPRARLAMCFPTLLVRAPKITFAFLLYIKL